MRRIDIAADYNLINELVDLDRIEGFIKQRVSVEDEPSNVVFSRNLEEAMGGAVKVLIKEPIIDLINVKPLNENKIGEKLSVHIDYLSDVNVTKAILDNYPAAFFRFAVRELKRMTRENIIDINHNARYETWSQEKFAIFKHIIEPGNTYVVSQRILNVLFSLDGIKTQPVKLNKIYDIIKYKDSYLIVDDNASEDYVMHLPKTTVYVSKKVHVIVLNYRSCVLTHEQIIESDIQNPVQVIRGLLN